MRSTSSAILFVATLMIGLLSIYVGLKVTPLINSSSSMMSFEGSPEPMDGDDARTSSSFKLPFPVFVASLPKSATSTIYKYFLCGGQKSGHTWFKSTDKGTNETKVIRAGSCMKQNVLDNRPIFEGCGEENYDIWADVGIARPNLGPLGCYFPEIDGLEEIHRYHPTATIAFGIRNSTNWAQSAKRWGSGSMVQRWRACNFTGFIDTSFEGMKKFYEWHIQHVRDFMATHPSMTYLEFRIEDPDVGSILEAKTGVSASCWGHENKSKQRKRS